MAAWLLLQHWPRPSSLPSNWRLLGSGHNVEPLEGCSGQLERGPAGLGNHCSAPSHATDLSQMHHLPTSCLEDHPSLTSPDFHLCCIPSSVSFLQPLPSAGAPKLKRFSPSSLPPPGHSLLLTPGPHCFSPELLMTRASEQVNLSPSPQLHLSCQQGLENFSRPMSQAISLCARKTASAPMILWMMPGKTLTSDSSLSQQPSRPWPPSFHYEKALPSHLSLTLCVIFCLAPLHMAVTSLLCPASPFAHHHLPAQTCSLPREQNPSLTGLSMCRPTQRDMQVARLHFAHLRRRTGFCMRVCKCGYMDEHTFKMDRALAERRCV